MKNSNTNILNTINSNIGDLYSLLSSLLINLDNKDSLLTYLEYLSKNEDLKLQIGMVFGAASKILNNNKYVANANCNLPIEYNRDTWRSHKLIIDIFEHRPRTVEGLQEMIYFWQKEII